MVDVTWRDDPNFVLCAMAALSADFDSVPWGDAPEWRQDVAAATARAALDTGGNPDFTRMAWFHKRVELGWRWSQVYNEAAKTHPGIVAGELTRGGTAHWLEVCRAVRDVARARGVRMTGA